MADESSLILGDELCSGTETESALSIFSAGLMTLHNKRSSFIFATHFHEILKYDEIEMLENLALKHMSVHYDRAMDCLVYDRIIKDGPGNMTYGLEVCKSLYLDEEFLDRTYNRQTQQEYFINGHANYHDLHYDLVERYNNVNLLFEIRNIQNIQANQINQVNYYPPNRLLRDDMYHQPRINNPFIAYTDGQLVYRNENLLKIFQQQICCLSWIIELYNTPTNKAKNKKELLELTSSYENLIKFLFPTQNYTLQDIQKKMSSIRNYQI
jgi:hypothetical protein